MRAITGHAKDQSHGTRSMYGDRDLRRFQQAGVSLVSLTPGNYTSEDTDLAAGNTLQRCTTVLSAGCEPMYPPACLNQH